MLKKLEQPPPKYNDVPDEKHTTFVRLRRTWKMCQKSTTKIKITEGTVIEIILGMGYYSIKTTIEDWTKVPAKLHIIKTVALNINNNI